MSSRSFERALREGALTQLEWIDACSALPEIDGVDLGYEHFPRRDADYLAQIKKLCVDLCVTVAGVNVAIAFGSAEIDPQIEELAKALDAAAALGAPLARFRCGAAEGSPGIAWRELIRGLKHCAAHAKRVNVTLALTPRDGTLVASDADVKRALKECDSAWLRLAIPAEAAWEPHARDAVIMTAAPSGSDLAAAQRFRGFVSLEDESGELDDARLRRWAQSVAASAAGIR